MHRWAVIRFGLTIRAALLERPQLPSLGRSCGAHVVLGGRMLCAFRTWECLKYTFFESNNGKE